MRTIVNLCLAFALSICSLVFTANTDAFAEHRTVAAARQRNIQLWLVSTRHLSPDHGLPQNELKLKYQRFTADGRLIDSSRKAFESADTPDVPTSVIVHGSPANLCQVIDAGHQLYDLLLCRSPVGSSGRIVLWTWPTDKVCKRLLNDFRLKGSWSEYQGYFLARFVDRIDPKVPVTLAGYSFGARAVGTALHLMGGGSFPSGEAIGIPDPQPRAKPMSAVFLAAGIDDDWLDPDGRYGQALSAVGYALNTTNACDPILKRYHLLCGLRGGPTSIGYWGIDPAQLGPYRDRYEEIDVSSDAGKSHDVFRYLESEELLRRIVGLLLKAP